MFVHLAVNTRWVGRLGGGGGCCATRVRQGAEGAVCRNQEGGCLPQPVFVLFASLAVLPDFLGCRTPSCRNLKALALSERVLPQRVS